MPEKKAPKVRGVDSEAAAEAALWSALPAHQFPGP